MDENTNSLITGDLSSTIQNINEFLRFLTAASEGAEACDPGMGHGLRLVTQAASWASSEAKRQEQIEKSPPSENI